MTKARTLEFLKNECPELNILPIFIVNSDEYLADRDKIAIEIVSFSEGRKLIVRSSARGEDNINFSNAGGFDTILNVEPDESHIKKAVEEVYSSYNSENNEEILVQPMLENVSISGVIFTADMDTFADYYIANYSESSDTAAVTGGEGKRLKTFIHYKGSDKMPSDPTMQKLIGNCKIIEAALENHALDIEFAVTKGGEVYILQARPIAVGNKALKKPIKLDSALKKIYKKIQKLSRRHPFLLGDTTYFGVMPDWNPAEILGVRPRKLAISLYKELVTDNVWANQRYNYGYRDLTLHPLMVSFCGIPYVDTRITFNSFVPKSLNEKIAEKLVNHYLKRLRDYPKYHDKIEFEIVFSCYYFGISNKLCNLLKHGFNENELKRIEYSLLDLTNNIIDPKTGLYKKDIEQIKILEKNYEIIVNSNISLADKIYWLIEECKKYGTLTFAGAARAGFIAVQFLRSFVEYGIITQTEYDRYMNSISTVNKRLTRDLGKYFGGMMSKEEFLRNYGHIRPGTYDIMSPRYDENFDEYFSHYDTASIQTDDYSFSDEIMERIQTELEQHGLSVTADELICFIKEAIEGREYLKFVFTKSVSKILSLIEDLGVRTGISKEDMSHLDISVVKQLYSDLYSGDVSDIFKENIENNKKQHDIALRIKLPAIIVDPENIYNYYLLEEEPNFITQKSFYGETVCVDDNIADPESKIVFIRSADPGYDYLFSKKIGGLITQFGGANSHMAIRCAELGIPAVIGAGEKNYENWKRNSTLLVDCAKRQVIPAGTIGSN